VAEARSIQILPENVVHKIAAGEVVERPVSVVKELVENSLDAGATRIRVEIENGGLKRIAVSDDGWGIFPQELPLSLKRHATSKIQSAEDLFSLNTLGFRGEALPSIASVSDFRIESTTPRTAPVGYALEVKAGKTSDLKEAALDKGTRVIVENLFCTTPARLKFLKRPETEWGHVYDLITALALSHVAVEWELTHNGKRSLFCPRAGEPRQRVLDLFGKDVMGALYPLEREVAGIRLSGLIGHPNFSKKSNRQLFVFVNGRYVQDRLIQHAILSGYRGLLMTQQYPMAVLYLGLDSGQVDVNVHPAKREVRFSNSNSIHHLIAETIRNALEAAPWREGNRQGFSEKLDLTRAGTPSPPLRGPSPTGGEGNKNWERLYEGSSQKIPSPLVGEGQGEGEASQNLKFRPHAKIGTSTFSELTVLGQFNQTYLVCARGESLILIDQHAAHERIGFEQLKKSHASGRIAQQGLLNPLTFELNEPESHVLRRVLPHLETFGFSVEEFGEKTFVLKAHPILLSGCDWIALLKDLAANFQEEAGLQSIEEKIDHVLATMACHRQVRAGDSLRKEEMQELLKQLEGTPRSYHCPHGRPVMVEIESREIEKWFKRVL
jgi:DNA mismatch repair protein MutL